MSRPVLVGLIALAGAAVFAAGCGQQMRAERDARDLADSICDLRNADDADGVNEALDDINEQLDDLSRRFGVATAEDRADVDENLSDLAEHAVQGNEVLLQQDLAVLQRSAENIRDEASGVQQAAWSGFADGVRECIED
jgi:hypothetical protein